MNFLVKMKPTKDARMKDLIEKIKSRYNTTVLSEITNGKDLGVITTTKTFQLADRHIIFQFVFKEDELQIFEFVYSRVFQNFYKSEIEDLIELIKEYGYQQEGEIISYTVYNSSLA